MCLFFIQKRRDFLTLDSTDYLSKFIQFSSGKNSYLKSVNNCLLTVVMFSFAKKLELTIHKAPKSQGKFSFE